MELKKKEAKGLPYEALFGVDHNTKNEVSIGLVREQLENGNKFIFTAEFTNVDDFNRFIEKLS